MAELPTSFHQLPRASFPVSFWILDAATVRLLWYSLVEGPGALRIPGVAEVNGGRPVVGVVIFASGLLTETGPDMVTRAWQNQ